MKNFVDGELVDEQPVPETYQIDPVDAGTFEVCWLQETNGIGGITGGSDNILLSDTAPDQFSTTFALKAPVGKRISFYLNDEQRPTVHSTDRLLGVALLPLMFRWDSASVPFREDDNRIHLRVAEPILGTTNSFRFGPAHELFDFSIRPFPGNVYNGPLPTSCL